MALALELVVASGEAPKRSEDFVKTVGLLGVADAALAFDCIPTIVDIRSKVVIRIEETEVSLLIFELIFCDVKGSVFHI